MGGNYYFGRFENTTVLSYEGSSNPLLVQYQKSVVGKIDVYEQYWRWVCLTLSNKLSYQNHSGNCVFLFLEN